MPYRVYFADDARDDFNSIVDFIAADSPRRALSFVDELENARSICFRSSHSATTSLPMMSMKQEGGFVPLVSEGHHLWRDVLDDRTREVQAASRLTSTPAFASRNRISLSGKSSTTAPRTDGRAASALRHAATFGLPSSMPETPSRSNASK